MQTKPSAWKAPQQVLKDLYRKQTTARREWVPSKTESIYDSDHRNVARLTRPDGTLEPAAGYFARVKVITTYEPRTRMCTEDASADREGRRTLAKYRHGGSVAAPEPSGSSESYPLYYWRREHVSLVSVYDLTMQSPQIGGGPRYRVLAPSVYVAEFIRERNKHLEKLVVDLCSCRNLASLISQSGATQNSTVSGTWADYQRRASLILSGENARLVTEQNIHKADYLVRDPNKWLSAMRPTWSDQRTRYKRQPCCACDICSNVTGEVGDSIDEAKLRLFGDNGGDHVPSSAQLWALCKMDSREFITTPAVSVPAPFRQPNRSCPECFGFGFKIVLRRFDISGASRCPSMCPILTGGDGSSEAPYNYAQERLQPRPHKPVAGNVRMRDVKRAVVEARR